MKSDTWIFTAAAAACLGGCAWTARPAESRYVGRMMCLAEDEPAGETCAAVEAAPRPLPANPPAIQPTKPAPKAGIPHWVQRRGPAYPNDRWRTLGRDVTELPATVWLDAKAVASDHWSLAGLAAAGVAGLALSGDGGNDCAERHFSKHGNSLGGFWDSVGDVGGSPGTHFAVAAAMYAWSLHDGDTKRYETSKTLVNALAINGLLTLGLKGLAHTESPNGDEAGWPSGHTSSTFCFATVMHKAYGPWAGMPLYAFATFVGYERLSARNHDLSDVVSGALIGIAVGHAVSENHRLRIFGMDVVPYVSPGTGGTGIALTKRW